MATSIRNILLVGGILAVVGTAATLILLDSDKPTRTSSALTGPTTREAGAEDPRTATASGTGMRSLATESADLSGRSELAVEVYDPGGNPLFKALVTPTILAPVDDSVRPPLAKLQPARWSGLAPGEVQLLVECKGYLAHQETVELTADEAQSVRVTLTPHGKLTGTVSTPTGRPVSTYIWVLGTNQEHPPTPEAARELPQLRSDRYGRFEVDFPEERTVHVSVGFMGKPDLADGQPFQLGPGIHKTLDIVVAENCEVEIQVAGMPPLEEIGGRSNVVVTVERLEKRKDRPVGAPSDAARDSEGLGDEDVEASRERTRSGGAMVTTTDEWWRTVAAGQPDENGRVSLSIEKPGDNHRLTVTVNSRHRQVSDTTFGLRRGRPITIHTTLPPNLPTTPPKGTARGPAIGVRGGDANRSLGGGGGDAGKRPNGGRTEPPPLSIAVSPKQGPEKVRKQGFYWGDA